MKTTAKDPDVARLRRAGRDLAQVAIADIASVETVLVPPGPLATASIENVLAALSKCADLWPRHERHRPHMRRILTHLEALPGQSWTDRWNLFESTVGTDTTSWRDAVRPGAETAPREALNAAMGPLLALDVIRPSYPWLAAQKFQFFGALSAYRDPGGTQELTNALAATDAAPEQASSALHTMARIQAHTGKHLRAVDAADILAMVEAMPGRLLNFSRSGLNTLWPVLHQLGWIEHESSHMPSRRRRGQQTIEAMVDYYGIREPFRDPLVRYLRIRSTALDYTSLRGLATQLVGNFWADVMTHHPDLTSFALTPEQADAWKARIKVTRHGHTPRPRKEWHSVYFQVRAFYLDVAQWALEDAYWAGWSAPSPIAFAETRGYNKKKRARVAQQHQRTRELSSVLHELVAAAERELREATDALASAHAVGSGGRIRFAGRTWEVFQRVPGAPIRARSEGLERDLTRDEDMAFWTWAIVETLRHSGIRIEEMLELVHLSIQPYKVRGTGETVPLLHVTPSKTDTERLLVASPELVHVLYRVLSRILDGAGSVPLTQRWDPHEKTLGPQLPHLFVRRHSSGLRVIAPNTVAKLLDALVDRSGITVNGAPAHFTPHDFRRIFATEALASGLPPHIVQVIMGHQSLSTTQGYAAVYPKDVIRHHRTFITQRRQLRPSEEYREPTAAEWDEFEAHFVTRKLSLGSCGRAFGTACNHEHACLRCALLRPDPRERPRLIEIMANLDERIVEAEEHGWIGDAEGLRVTLASAESKLAQMDAQLARDPAEPVLLGLPRAPRGG